MLYSCRFWHQLPAGINSRALILVSSIEVIIIIVMSILQVVTENASKQTGREMYVGPTFIIIDELN